MKCLALIKLFKLQDTETRDHAKTVKQSFPEKNPLKDKLPVYTFQLLTTPT